jgi:hypothetical protein
MENNLSKQENTHSKGRDSTQSDGIVLEKKDGNILLDSAASYVRTVTPFETDIGSNRLTRKTLVYYLFNKICEF